MHILIVEDEPNIRDIMSAYLENEGWKVDTTADGNEAVRKYDNCKHDLVLLDLMIEGISGEEVCKKLREISNVPIFIITSKSKESDTINGLNLGADDYIIKPFRMKEVIARIKALFRRINTIVTPDLQVKELSYDRGKVRIHLDNRSVTIRGTTINLTSTEFKLLTVLTSKPGKIFSRNDLTYEVLGYRFAGDSRAIDTHVKNLRRKMEEDKADPRFILTMVGSGYKFGVMPDERTP